WLSARFPGRLGGGFGPGSPTTPDDFVVGRIPMEQRRKIFGENLQIVARALQGEAPPPLDNDPAIKACKADPVPCMSTVGGPLGARRAARLGIGLVPSSGMDMEQMSGFIREYHLAGGTKSVMINRRAWLGEPDAERMKSLIAHNA